MTCRSKNVGIGRRRSGPRDELIGPHQHERCAIALAPPLLRIGHDHQRNPVPLGGAPKRLCHRIVLAEAEQGEALAQLLEHAAPIGERLRRQMVTGFGLEPMASALGTGLTALRPVDDRRALVMRLERVHLAFGAAAALGPLPLEGGLVAGRVVSPEEVPVRGDRALDEIPRRGQEDRPPLRLVRLQQSRAAPALQHRRQLPAEIGRVLEARVDAVAAIGRVAVGRIAGDEHAAGAILVGGGDAQVPKADMLDLDGELRTGSAVQQGSEVVIVLRRAGRHRGVEEPRAAEVDPAEELPIPAEIRMQHTIERLAGIARQQPVQLLGAEHQQHHPPVVIRLRLADPGLLAHDRAAAVAAHGIRSRYGAPARPVPLRELHRHAVLILRHGVDRPAEQRRHRRQLRDPGAQDRLGRVLRQALVVGEVERLDQFALHPIVMILASAACRTPSSRPSRSRAGSCAPRATPSRRARSGNAPSCAGSGSGRAGSAAAADTARRPGSGPHAAPTRPPARDPPGRRRRSPHQRRSSSSSRLLLG